MVNENVGPTESRQPEKSSAILTKPLPQVLDDMDGNIRAAAEAARKAQEAANRAEEARKAGEKAAESAMRAAAEAVSKTEDIAKAATAAAKEAAEIAAEQATRKAEEAFAKAEEALPSKLVKKVLSSWDFLAVLIMILVGAIFASVAISLGLSLIGR